MKHFFSYSLRNIVFVLLACIVGGCASMRQPVVNRYEDSVYNYRYFYISPTGDYTSSTGIYGDKDIVIGGTTKSINPASVISGILFKNGYVQINEIRPEVAKETMIVNFGETGRRNVNLSYAIEVTIQFVSASTLRPICSSTAEGLGSTEADDVRIAIQRALEPVFNLHR